MAASAIMCPNVTHIAVFLQQPGKILNKPWSGFHMEYNGNIESRGNPAQTLHKRGINWVILLGVPSPGIGIVLDDDFSDAPEMACGKLLLSLSQDHFNSFVGFRPLI